MKFLKQLLEGYTGAANDVDAIIAHVEKKAEEQKVKLLLDDGDKYQYIPKDRLDKEIDKRKNIDTQLENANKTIGELKDTIKDNEGAVNKVKELEDTNKALQTEYGTLVRNQVIKESISKFERQPKDYNDLLRFIDEKKVEVKNGEALGLKEELDNLVKSKEYLFEPIEGGSGKPGNPPGGSKTPPGGQKSMGEELAKSSAESIKSVVEAQNKFFE